ncbi:hypothetical protein [Streptomyces cyslabdanicus]|uniref:hypothetical protein n=1 Tax=Streptomyces cyslabdanicus TaxID=1470456 RepID=UPI004043AA18
MEQAVDPTPPALGLLKIEVTFPDNRAAVVDWTREPQQRLLRALGAELAASCAVGHGTGSPHTLRNRARSCREWARWIESTERVELRVGDLLPRHLDGFESHLRERHPESSRTPYARIADIVWILRRMSERREGLSSAMVRRLAYTSAGPVGSYAPRDAYSPRVVEQLRAAARSDVDHAVRRLTLEGPTHCAHIGFPVPDVDGEPWNLTTRQFRRTVAWHIAHRPYGTVAGMIQYKHLSVAMFEGYAGTSASGFRAEVAAEEAMARLADVVERYEDFKAGVRSSAPGSTRTDNEFARVQEELHDFPGRVVDERRLHAMLRTSANTLHVGTLNDCYYQPETALCRTAGGADQPMLNNCRPDRCGNSTTTSRHRSGWEAAHADTERALTFVGLSDLQRTALREHLNDVSKVIEGIGRAND